MEYGHKIQNLKTVRVQIFSNRMCCYTQSPHGAVNMAQGHGKMRFLKPRSAALLWHKAIRASSPIRRLVSSQFPEPLPPHNGMAGHAHNLKGCRAIDRRLPT